ncbi:HDOD domain-containing protein [Marinobacter confluentis]|uniref:HDOD domain-containing protein n=1 Tax=Marinobacter confluentis TaxID=1697557 RepID=A0A4Z1BT56_9GAMM|nr:HDOD domain-containing protein [Marinobacter confluentis]TGN40379.1 HDOD domain-containing protein [Marinobacter confluentis]
MPGLFSWFTAKFSPRTSVAAQPSPRLLNPTGRPGLTYEAAQQPSTLELEKHLFCWLLDAPPAALTREQDSGAQSILHTLEQRIHRQTLDELPRRPMTLPMLTRALSDEKTDRKELAEIILSDPALTDQLLHVANSPLFRTGDKPIESVDQAVFRLGLNGIRNVISAAVMRPMMAARNSREALFAQRVWRWGLTCAKAAELVSALREKDSSLYFMTGLLPALSYITLRRELQRICRSAPQPFEPSPSLTHQALSRFQWATAQVLANEWNLEPEYHARLMEAERPTPNQTHAPLNDGIIIGTREILRHAHQKNMAEEDVLKLVHIPPDQFVRIRRIILDSIEAGSKARA